MINFHPDDNLLTEYSSGSLAWALSVGVCAHLQFCLHCRQRVAHLNKLGAAILVHSQPEQVNPSALAKVMERVRRVENKGEDTSEEPREKINSAAQIGSYLNDPMLSNLPKVIAKLLPQNGQLKWQRVSSSLKTARLAVGQSQYEVAFQKISSGGKVVEHDHRGLEITLVLRGSFSDEKGIYNEGDFLVRSPGEIHRPTATQNQDCLCLSIVEAPVAVTGLIGKIINPFLSFKPA